MVQAKIGSPSNLGGKSNNESKKEVTVDKQQFTLYYVTTLTNHLSIIGARAEMRKMQLSGVEVEILRYLKKDDGTKTQLFLEYVYVGNRVGGGLRQEILDKDIVFQTWKPYWWGNLWQILEPLVIQERERRHDKILYADFEWFIKEVCQNKGCYFIY